MKATIYYYAIALLINEVF